MFKNILAISGKPGLYKLISSTSNAIIVESLIDGKRMSAYSSAKIMSLDEISIYTENEDMPLKVVFNKIHEKSQGAVDISSKDGKDKILSTFESILPEYDKGRVYISDMKKIFNWYNILISHNFIPVSE